jgi:large subunit ribosomal protein L5
MTKSLDVIYKESLMTEIQKELGLDNIYAIPRVDKVVINIGVGDAHQNPKGLESIINELTWITGQKPVITKAKKSIAGFKVREGMPVGVKVTLRGKRMYLFLAKLISVVFPRIRDFRGLNESGFDGFGNYNIGLKDQLVFPEIDYDKIHAVRGMNISVVTTASNDVQCKVLLKHIGFPFKSELLKA